MKNKIKLLISLLVIISSFFIFSTSTKAEALDEDEQTCTLYFRLDYSQKPGKGHTTPGNERELDDYPDVLNAWNNMKITVTSNDLNSPVYNTPAPELADLRRNGGTYKVGTEITVTIETSGLPEGYHLSMDTLTKEEGAAYNKRYWTDNVKFVLDPKLFYPSEPERSSIDIVVPLAIMDVKFDLQGGNISGNEDPIVERVGKDNHVKFPVDPIKSGLIFNGWYSEVTGKYTYFWKPSNYFSDYTTDFQKNNDEDIDPMYDGVFLLRADWIALVNFDSQGGSNIDQQKVREGATATKPEDPTKDKAEFVAWIDQDGNQYDFTKPVTRNMTLTASWKESEQHQPEEPQEPIKPAEPETPSTPAGNLELPTATVESVQLTFDPSGGVWPSGSTDPMIIYASVGDLVRIPLGPVKEGSKFVYWEGSQYNPGDMYEVTGDHYFTAHYEDYVSMLEGENSQSEKENNLDNNLYNVENLPKTGEQSTAPVVLASAVGLGLLITLRKKLEQ
jgi:LPXTG-motif cell wall-anchored protein